MVIGTQARFACGNLDFQRKRQGTHVTCNLCEMGLTSGEGRPVRIRQAGLRMVKLGRFATRFRISMVGVTMSIRCVDNSLTTMLSPYEDGLTRIQQAFRIFGAGDGVGTHGYQHRWGTPLVAVAVWRPLQGLDGSVPRLGNRRNFYLTFQELEKRPSKIPAMSDPESLSPSRAKRGPNIRDDGDLYPSPVGQRLKRA